ncbi:uncharacterized protein TrAtP1_008191 [Trichoderma atroviride]|uniref:Uncharacterized protein n=1 Tax=Hypocrea atroviridis (strain ATCC 20476 / IMI 206040) TaxID=452589 RepID=G9NZ63_HYPAI|nr:uncharacterized protein TRIATDRAFT_309174 [Trichoderma atroviride IMI 206040]EHK43778.1 hypothetical protein TRIATDRAFT_309174 [Trichoderma atroviride IMI 206040]UKZ67027.1 hypothetical protein TrAtP1_008191 [Trichoderma atroviride]
MATIRDGVESRGKERRKRLEWMTKDGFLLDLAAWSPSMSLTDSGRAVATAVQKRHSAHDCVSTAGVAARSSEILPSADPAVTSAPDDGCEYEDGNSILVAISGQTERFKAEHDWIYLVHVET